MRKYAMILGLILGLGATQIVEAQAFTGCATGKEQLKPTNEEFEAEVVRLVNVERKKKGIAPLKLDADLTRSARYHAQDMAEEQYFDHSTHDKKNGKLVKVCGTFDRIKKFAPDYGYRAENISAGDETPKEVVNGWMNSSGHRQNILNKNYTHIGVGYYKTNKGYGDYWVQCFGGK